MSEATRSGTGSLPASQSRTSLGHTPSFRASRTCPQAIRRNSRLSCAGVNSAQPVSPLGRRPRGLRLMEELQQLPLSELSEGCVGTLRTQRRIASEAALALGAGPEFEQQPKLILPINGDAARGINLPDAWTHCVRTYRLLGYSDVNLRDHYACLCVLQRLSAQYIPPMPPPPGIEGIFSFSFFSTTTHSVVRSSPAMDAAFCSAVRVTLVGSMTPAATRSSYSSVWAL